MYSVSRRIAHLDMDAFFASVELLDYPELRGHAVVVGGRSAQRPALLPDGTRQFARLRDYTGRGVATTATYEARALGVFSGMGLMKSAQLAPEATLLPANFAAYSEYSRRFKAAVAALAPHIEDRGIDEIYIDLAGLDEDSHVLAQRLQQAVFDATGLSCSIGVAPNKLLAKICSDLNKPHGITVLRMDEVPARIWPLPVKRINGVGPKTAAHLARLGIVSIGDLAACPVTQLMQTFGQHSGQWLHRAAHGLDESSVKTWHDPKSVSRERTFERDLHVQHDRDELSARFSALCRQVADDLERAGYAAQTIGVKLRFADFQTLTRDRTLDNPVCEAAHIRRAAGECLKRVVFGQRIRLLGVRASGLAPRGSESESAGLLLNAFPSAQISATERQPLAQ